MLPSSVTVLATAVHTVVITTANVAFNPMEYVTKCYRPQPVPTKIKGQLGTSLGEALWSVDKSYENNPQAKTDIEAIVSAALQDPLSVINVDQISLGVMALTDLPKEDWYRNAVPTEVQAHVAAYQDHREAVAERIVGHPANLICEDQWVTKARGVIKMYDYGC